MGIFNFLKQALGIDGSGSAFAESYKIVGPREFKTLISKKKVQLLDVRTPGEFASGHIKGAKNLNVFDAQFQNRIQKLKKDQPVYVYCRSGSRSRRAAKRLIKNGIEQVYDLRGGYMNWK